MRKHKGNRKHFTIRQRHYIEFAIGKGISIMEMANFLGFSRQSIYREIQDNRYPKFNQKRALEYSRNLCLRLTKYPFVCNVCKFKQGCPHIKYYYRGDVANDNASDRLVVARRGTRLSKGELLNIEEIITPGIRKGQSIHHVYTANKDKINVSQRTIRNLINRNELSVRNIDLPLTVAQKPPKKEYAKVNTTRPLGTLFGRMHVDFKGLIGFGDHYAQSDSVIGKRSDKKTILTIHFPTLSFMFGLLCEYKGWLPVNNHFYALREKLGPTLYEKAFPVILVDRGNEFDRLFLLEDDNGEGTSKVFYADAYNSTQRAEIESNHRLIRRIIPKGPKGRSFEFLTQNHLDLMFSHINGLIREKQGNRTGYELAKEYLGQDFLNAINIKYIAPDEVTLKPYLFDKLQK